MNIERMTAADFAEILRDIVDFWGSDRTLHMHHPMFVQEFGDTAYVVRSEGRVIAYFIGFLSQAEPVAYGHLAAVRKSCQRAGLGLRLWNHFIEHARSRGCREIKGITTPGNQASIEFHTKKIGMTATQIENYGGSRKTYIVFRRPI